MVYVPSARAFGFDLRLNETALSELLNSGGVKTLTAAEAAKVKSQVEAHVRATATSENADNYVATLFAEDSFSDDYGFNFGGPYGLGNRPISIIGVPAGRGKNPSAKPPLLVEAETHALTSVPGFTVGARGEDIR